MSTNRTERLLNLVIALSATRRWLAKEQIRHAVPQYEACESTEAFDRMFERDKEDLRELGVPLVTGSYEAWFDDEVGYRIDRDAYPLPLVELTPVELSVLALASRVWQQATLAGPAARALVKLKALGVGVDTERLAGLEPRVRAGEAAFEPLYAATRDGVPVGFGYRKPIRARPAQDGGTPAHAPPVEQRRVAPWALTNRGGWWYLVGRDLDRQAPRVFRLSRIQLPVRRIGSAGSVVVPEGIDPAAMVGRGRGESDSRTARLRLGPQRAMALRVRPDARETGADLLELPVGDVARFAEELAGYGPDVVVLDPPDLAEAVRERLRAVQARHTVAPGAGTGAPSQRSPRR